tara:strand:- start:333 stop:824 length:492 start_codon:yes stop_codon:yes gene_type:complete
LIFSGDKSATPFIFAHAWSNVLDKLLNASARTITDSDLSRLLPFLSYFRLPNDDDVNADDEDKNVDFVPLLDGEKPILRLPFDDAPLLITLKKPARALVVVVVVVVVVVIFSRLLFQRVRESESARALIITRERRRESRLLFIFLSTISSSSSVFFFFFFVFF